MTNHLLGGLAGGFLGAVALGLKPLAKKLLVLVIKEEGQVIKADLDQAIQEKGAAGVAAVLDNVSARLKLLVSQGRFLSPAMKGDICTVIDTEAAALKTRLTEEAVGAGTVEVDAEYAKLEAAILARLGG